MWVAACTECSWTSGKRVAKEAAEIMGEIHQEDYPGHIVKTQEALDPLSHVVEKPVGRV